MTAAAIKRKMLSYFRPVADDATGYFSVPPGIEINRELVSRVCWEEDEPLPNQHAANLCRLIGKPRSTP